MICRKCGAEIPDNSIRCQHCGIKVHMVCPQCNKLVLFGEKNCSFCGIELIKICSNCNSANLASSTECRKCGFSLVNEISVEKSNENVIDDNVVKTDDIIDEIDVENDENVSINDSIEETDISEEISVVREENVVQGNSNQDIVSYNNEDDILDSFSSTFVNCPNLKNASINDLEEPILEEKDVNLTQQEEKKEEKEFVSQEIVDTEASIEKAVKEIVLEDVINNDSDDNNIENNDENLEEETDIIDETEENVPQENVVEDIQDDFSSDLEQKSNEDIEDEILFDENIEIEPIEEFEIVNNKIDFDKENQIQEGVVNNIVHLIKTSISKHVIALNGPEGSGKTAVLKQVEKNLVNDGYLFLYGSCTPLLQITTFGYFQDAFLRLMGFPPFTKSIESFVKGFKESEFVSHFSFLSNQEMNTFLNIFYPSEVDKFENILNNRDKIFELLEKVIKSFSLDKNLVLVIDNFELLDGASYDFIVYLLEKGYFTNRLKLLVAYQEDKAIHTYFEKVSSADEIFEMLSLNKMSDEDLLKAVKNSLGIDIQEIFSEEYVKNLLAKCKGNALRAEQEIALLFDIGYISSEENEIIINEDKKLKFEISSIDELIKMRLNSLSPAAKNVLFTAAIMGYRFSTNILCLAVSLPNMKAENLLDFLSQEMYISPVDNYTCEFKSLTLWKLIYQEATKDILYKENATKLYETLKPLILSSNLQKLISCRDALPKNDAFKIWQDTVKLCAKLGDTNLYVISLKQCLKLLEDYQVENSDEIKLSIYEQIGKILCEKSPTEAITYLSTVLNEEIKCCNLNKIIDLSGYFVKSCYLSCNYFGAAEAVDKIISCIEQSEIDISDMDLALIKSRKLKALINIGNSEQIINMVNEEILPVLSRSINSEKSDRQYKSILIDALLNAKVILAKAYAIQGNYQVFDEIQSIKQFMEKFSCESMFYNLQIELLEAFANTIFGDIKKSVEILNNISLKTNNINIDTELLSEWNLINVINRIFVDEKDGLKSDLFELATFTNNINEQFTKNIIKLILGYILKEEGNKTKALEIFNEQITYFAKEKVAIGALLSWLLIVQMKMEDNDETALSTAIKSLEIAQSPKINNFLFTIYFQKCIADMYMQKEDYSAVKMYLEKSIMIAQKQNLKYQLIDLYIAYGEFMQEFMRDSNAYTKENIKLTSDMYEKANVLAREIEIDMLIEKTQKYKNEYKIFRQLNSI